jgi:hypothetical protein
VTFFSGFGTLIVISGVVLYNEARDAEKKTGFSTIDHTALITWRDV